MTKYINKGEVIDYKATADIALGDVVSLTNAIGVAGNNIKSGEVGEVYLEGVFDMEKTSALALSVGDVVYFNTTTKKITKTNSDVPAGICVLAALADDTTCRIKIG